MSPVAWLITTSTTSPLLVFLIRSENAGCSIRSAGLRKTVQIIATRAMMMNQRIKFRTLEFMSAPTLRLLILQTQKPGEMIHAEPFFSSHTQSEGPGRPSEANSSAAPNSLTHKILDSIVTIGQTCLFQEGMRAL